MTIKKVKGRSTIIISSLKQSELTNEDKKAIAISKEEIIRGKTIPAEQLFKELGL